MRWFLIGLCSVGCTESGGGGVAVRVGVDTAPTDGSVYVRAYVEGAIDVAYDDGECVAGGTLILTLDDMRSNLYSAPLMIDAVPIGLDGAAGTIVSFVVPELSTDPSGRYLAGNYRCLYDGTTGELDCAECAAADCGTEAERETGLAASE